MDIELGDLVALPDQAEELALGGLQGGVGHHVQQPDMQLADVLVQGPIRVEDLLALVAQALKVGRSLWATMGMVHPLIE